MKQQHNIAPIFDQNSRVLVLGSFPSVKSRENGFYYFHPQNRFWRVLERLYGSDELKTVGQKREFLLRHNIALWDVISSCDVTGSSDSSIKNVVLNDVSMITDAADIKAVFCNGAAAYRLYCRYLENEVGMSAVQLPSTSPANAAFSLDRLCEEWKAITEY